MFFWKKNVFCIVSLLCKGAIPCDQKHRPNLRPQVPVRDSVFKNKMEISGGDCPLSFIYVHTMHPHKWIHTHKRRQNMENNILVTLKYKMLKKTLPSLPLNVLCYYEYIWILCIQYYWPKSINWP